RRETKREVLGVADAWSGARAPTEVRDVAAGAAQEVTVLALREALDTHHTVFGPESQACRRGRRPLRVDALVLETHHERVAVDGDDDVAVHVVVAAAVFGHVRAVQRDKGRFGRLSHLQE